MGVSGQPADPEQMPERRQRAFRHTNLVSDRELRDGGLSDREARQEVALVREQREQEGGREDPKKEGERALQQRKLLGADKAARQQEGLKLRGAWGGVVEWDDGRGREERVEG